MAKPGDMTHLPRTRRSTHFTRGRSPPAWSCCVTVFCSCVHARGDCSPSAELDRRESNPHASRHYVLNVACLPFHHDPMLPSSCLGSDPTGSLLSAPICFPGGPPGPGATWKSLEGGAASSRTWVIAAMGAVGIEPTGLQGYSPRLRHGSHPQCRDHL